MKCRDCGKNSLKVSYDKNTATCKYCGFTSDLVEFLGSFRDDDGNNWNFTLDGDVLGSTRYKITVGGHLVGDSIFNESKRVVRVSVHESGVAKTLVDFFKFVFKTELSVIVETTCIDPQLECPVCLKATNFSRSGEMMVCDGCNRYQTNVDLYLFSRLLSHGYIVYSDDCRKNEFKIYKKRFLFTEDVLVVEKRKNIYAVRPLGVDKDVCEVVAYLESLNITDRVVQLLRK